MKNFFFLFLSLVTLTCSIDSENTNELKNYTLFLDEDIYVEKFDSTVTNDGRFNENNEIFRPNVNFHYSYYYLSPQKEVLFLKSIEDEGIEMRFRWAFVPEEEVDTTTITSLVISATNSRRPFSKNEPDYNQTVLSYQYFTAKGYDSHELSGVVENEKNIWMHPPRFMLFQILELNPFPFIQQPYKVGNTYTWDMGIGDRWADSRWVEWDGLIQNFCTYEIMAIETLTTPMGNVDCFKIESMGKSELGKTYLTAWFSEKYGFVKLDYTNIDSSKIVFDLVAKN